LQNFRQKKVENFLFYGKVGFFASFVKIVCETLYLRIVFSLESKKKYLDTKVFYRFLSRFDREAFNVFGFTPHVQRESKFWHMLTAFVRSNCERLFQIVFVENENGISAER
jgi:hypothetical protein